MGRAYKIEKLKQKLIDVLFDLDFQKLVSKIWKQKSGILIVLVFSNTIERLNFFADSINPI